MNAKVISQRYNIDRWSAIKLLEQVEEKYEIDWSESSWKELDTFFALTAYRMSRSAPVSSVLKQNAIRILNWYEKEYLQKVEKGSSTPIT